MRIKAFLAFVLIVCMLGLLCACGSGAQASDTAAPSTAQNPSAEATAEQTAPEATEDGKIAYTVKVVDAAGAPMAGVMVQICKDTSCFAPTVTDAQGVATFKLAEGEGYKATFTVIPEGYTAETADVYFESGATEVTLTLAAA